MPTLTPPTDPVLIRHETRELSRGSRPRRIAQLLLIVIGLVSLGYYGYTIANEHVYEAYENWVFDHDIAGGGPVHLMDYLRSQTPVGWVLGRGESVPYSPVRKLSERVAPPARTGAVLGRVDIPRLHIEAIVREGVSSSVLSQAVGHVPMTAQAGQTGNFAIAAHRDTLFRGLKDIRKGDLVTFQSPDGKYTYQIFSMRIVEPTEVSVLRPDGALPTAVARTVAVNGGGPKLITLITCYPFFYVGSAPQRYIVQGQLVSGGSGPKPVLRQVAQLRTPRKPVAKHVSVKSKPYWKRYFQGA